MSFLSLKAVSVKYQSDDGDVAALQMLDLDVDAGEIVAVVGPSGCGKSTLLRAIAGLEPLTSGSIHLSDRDLHAVPTHQRDLGLMFQDHALFPHLTVAGNIGFGLKMRGRAVGESRARVAELLELVGLPDFADRTIDQLSGGEAQRVALARALAPSPSLLMLDEPLGSLDRVLREQLTADLRRLVTGLGVTALHVTHDQAEAFALADRVAVVEAGRLRQVGTPNELWHRPASRFVAGFLGHPNLWVRDEGEIVVPVPALALVRASGEQGSYVESDRRGTVELVEFREGRFRITAVSDDHYPGEPLVFEAVQPLAVGDPVSLSVDPGRIWCLPG
ncbi:MAG: thiamine transport system ATP-binding protein [Acidimicrobiales bacterium]